MLNQANLHISCSVLPTFRINENQDDLSQSWTLSQFLAIFVALGVPIGARTVLGMVARWGTGESLATVALPRALVAVASPWSIVGFVGSVVAAAVAKKVCQNTTIEKFKRNVRQAYDEFVTNSSQIQEIILKLLQCHCKPVKAVLDTFPQMHDQLQKTLAAIERAKKEHRPKYEELLSKCQDLNGKLSILILQCMPHKFTSNDISWPQPNPPVDSGSFC